MLDLEPVERADVLEVDDVGDPRVACGHHQDLVVSAGLVSHVEEADWARADQASGKCRLLEQDQRIQGVPVLAQGVLDVAIVGRVAGGGEQQPVEPDATGGVVHLILVAVSLGNLDRDVVLHSGTLRSRLADPRPSVSSIPAYSGNTWVECWDAAEEDVGHDVDGNGLAAIERDPDQRLCRLGVRQGHWTASGPGWSQGPARSGR